MYYGTRTEDSQGRRNSPFSMDTHS